VSDRPRPASAPDDDQVLAKRAAILHWSALGQRIAYMCFGASVVIFVVAFVAQFPTWMVTLTIALVGSVVFIPAVILSYGAKAADKEDAGHA